MARKNPIVTLLTDFGSNGPYVPAMKAMILHICPQATIVDLTHEIDAHDIWSGSFLLDQATREFGPESVHVAVVDPGVGSQRLGLAGKFDGRYYVFPDNGIISFVQSRTTCQGLVTLRNQQYMRQEGISMTFHGRDIFAPVGAHLASGVALEKLGHTPDRYTLLDTPQPEESEGILYGKIIYIDRFGNCVSNLPVGLLESFFDNLETVEVWCRQSRVGKLAGTYSFVAPGEGLALVNSMGLLEVAANQARAGSLFQAGIGDTIRVIPQGRQG